jgi:hypothetical protein
MSTTKPKNGRRDQPPDAEPAFPIPKAVWAAVNRDPEAVMALLWAINRLLTRKRQPFLCYPGGPAHPEESAAERTSVSKGCPFCHPEPSQLKTDS